MKMKLFNVFSYIGQSKGVASLFGQHVLFLRGSQATGSACFSETTKKDIEDVVREKLKQKFQPEYLEVINESAMHKVPKGSASHFRVIIVSHLFNDKKLVQCHRMVNDVLQEELKGPIHALSIEAVPSSQGEKNVQNKKSPPCKGGMGL